MNLAVAPNLGRARRFESDADADRPPLRKTPSAARERAVEVLTRHFANDDLTEAELVARLQR